MSDSYTVAIDGYTLAPEPGGHVIDRLAERFGHPETIDWITQTRHRLEALAARQGWQIDGYITEAGRSLVAQLTDTGGDRTLIAKAPILDRRGVHYAMGAYQRRGVGPQILAVEQGIIITTRVCGGRYFAAGDAEARDERIVRVLSAADVATTVDNKSVRSLQARMDERLSDAHRRTTDSPEDQERLNRLIAATVELVARTPDGTLCHGDLHEKNVLTDSDGGPCLIDPEPHRGPREIDAVKLCATLGADPATIAAMAGLDLHLMELAQTVNTESTALYLKATGRSHG